MDDDRRGFVVLFGASLALVLFFLAVCKTNGCL